MGTLSHRQQRILMLPVSAIRPNPMQPRQIFDEEGLQELAESIRRCGVLQPLTVRRQGSEWELVAGERRLRAAKLAGLSKVPCLRCDTDDETSALLALEENLQRQDLHYLEEAAALSAFLRRSGMTQEALAERLGRSPSALANKLRLRRLDPECMKLLLRSELTERHARALLALEDPAEQLAALKHILSAGLNVAQTERYIEVRRQALQTAPPTARRSYILKDVRLFLNSVDRSLRLMREAGVDAESGREETEDAILLTIRIPKQARKA